MDYGEVISKAWKIIWKNKVLWLFGILASCATRTGGGGGSGSGVRGGQSSGNNPFNFPQGYEQFFGQIQRMVENIPFWVYALIGLAFLALFILALFLGTIGRIGLIRGTIHGDEGVERQSFAQLFQESLPFFWRVFLLNLLLFIAGIVLVIILLIPTIGLTVITLGIGLVCLLPLFCIIGIFFWLASLVLEQATIAIIAENLGVVQGLERGWAVVRANIGPILVMALLILIGGGILGFIIAIPFLVLLIPVGLGFIMNTRTSISTGMVVAIVLACLYLPIVIVLRGILESYIEALWTLTFRRLTGVRPGAAPQSPELPTGAAVY